jgi:hypothetical protein
MANRMESRFGVRNVLHVDNLFDKGHLLQQPVQDLSFVVMAATDLAATRQEAEDIARACGLTPYLADVPALDDPQDVRPLFKAILATASGMVEAIS